MATKDRPRMLWHLGFYDHPLDGIAEYQGKPCYFQICEHGGWTSLDDLPQDMTKLSLKEIESIDTEDNIWAKDATYSLWEITQEQYTNMLRSFEDFVDSLKVRFSNGEKYSTPDHRPLSERKRQTTSVGPAVGPQTGGLKQGKYLGEFRWWQFEDYHRKE